MVERLWSPEAAGASEEEAALAGRLRFAAQSLAMEYPELSPEAAERLIFDVAQEFLSAAQVAQFVPTLATRRARQLLRRRQFEVVIPDVPEAESLSVVGASPPADSAPTDSAPTDREAPVPARASAPPRPPAYYASEAKRLLEKARTLRADTLLAVGAASEPR